MFNTVVAASSSLIPSLPNIELWKPLITNQSLETLKVFEALRSTVINQTNNGGSSEVQCIKDNVKVVQQKADA